MSAPVVEDVDQTFADSVKKSKNAAESGDAPQTGPGRSVLDAVKDAAEQTYQGLKDGATMVKETIIGGEKSPPKAKEDAQKSSGY